MNLNDSNVKYYARVITMTTVMMQVLLQYYSPYWKYNKPCDKERHTKHNEEEVAQALVFGIVGQLGCLLEKTRIQKNILCQVL